jgi:hypothetical protein
MDTNIQIPKKEIAPGIFTTGGVATVPVNNPITGQANVITTQSLQPAQPIPILPQPPVDTGTGASAVAGAETQANDFQTNYQNYLNNINQQTPEKMSFDNLLKEFTTASENTLGQGQIQLQAEQQAGLPAKYQERAGVQGQIKTGIAEYNRLKAEYDAQKANIEAGAGRKGLTTGAVMGQQGAVQRAAESALNAKAADIQILQAQDQALAGDIEAAQNTVNRAVDLMYKDREAVLALKRDQLNIAKEFLSDADKKRAEARDYAYKKEEQKIAEEKANAKTIENMLLEATPNAPANVIANAKAIKDKGGSALEVAQALGKYGGDYLKTELLKAQIETEKAQRSNYNANAAKTRAETGLLGQPVGIDGVIATLPKSSQERYYKLQGDFDQATKNYRGAIDSASSITALSKDATPQQQTAIIFQYMKTLDPSSTVREGEFALVGATAGLGDRAVNALKRLDNGSRLNETQINDIVGATKILAENAKKNLEATSNEYDRRAVKFGLPKGLFYEQQDMAQSPADNKFGQAIGIQAPVNYNTTGMSVKPDGSIQFTLPTINKSN